MLEKWPGRRVKVTDSLVMGNCSKLVLSLSSRELTFFDMVDDFKCKFKLHGEYSSFVDNFLFFLDTCELDLPCIPLCLNYYFDPKVRVITANTKSIDKLLYCGRHQSQNRTSYTEMTLGLCLF